MDYLPQSVHWLIPEEKAPCDLYLYFRGLFPQALQRGMPIPFSLLEKIQKNQCLYTYIKPVDQSDWDHWIAGRNLVEQSKHEEFKKKKTNLIFSGKRHEYLSYMQKALTLKLSADKELASSHQKSLDLLQSIVKNPSLDWYFQQFHEPPDLFYHGARVSLSIAVFVHLNKLLLGKDLENILYSSIIHELQGDPKSSMKTIVSVSTLEYLEKKKIPVSQEILTLLQKHDELCNGSGFPNNCNAASIPFNVKIFTIFNHYDHYRLQQNGTRRSRHEAVKKIMEAQKSNYDKNIWSIFWGFWEEEVEFVI